MPAKFWNKYIENHRVFYLISLKYFYEFKFIDEKSKLRTTRIKGQRVRGPYLTPVSRNSSPVDLSHCRMEESSHHKCSTVGGHVRFKEHQN